MCVEGLRGPGPVLCPTERLESSWFGGGENLCVFWLPAAALLFLAIVLALKKEWFPSDTTDVLQMTNNGTFQSSSRYFRRAFLSRNPKCFSRLSSGSWDEEAAAHECVFLEAGTRPRTLFPALWVAVARTRGVFVHTRPELTPPPPSFPPLIVLFFGSGNGV